MSSCTHHACRCARAEELASMGMLVEAIQIHDQEVVCRRHECTECGRVFYHAPVVDPFWPNRKFCDDTCWRQHKEHYS